MSGFVPPLANLLKWLDVFPRKARAAELLPDSGPQPYKLMAKQSYLDWVISHPFQVMIGKGGVGKSSLSAALGLVLARHGKRTVIIETDVKERMSQLFQVPPVGYNEVEVFPNLFAKNVDPDSSMEEYALRFVRFQAVYDAIFKKSFLKHWIKGMPGFREFVVLGKIWDMGQLPKGHKSKYDVFIIDSPATGHGLSLWALPRQTQIAVGVGPLARHAGLMNDYFTKKGQAIYHVVTLAEEMPFNETRELLEKMKGELSLPRGMLAINAVHPQPVRPELKGLLQEVQDSTEGVHGISDVVGGMDLARSVLACASSQQIRADLNQKYVEDYRTLSDAALELPYIYSRTYDKTTIEFLSHELEKKLKNMAAPS